MPSNNLAEILVGGIPALVVWACYLHVRGLGDPASGGLLAAVVLTALWIVPIALLFATYDARHR